MAKILVVDDSPDILVVLKATFENAGHEVISTDAPGEVLGIVERERPDACVLDVVMPGISGWDLLDQMRRRPDMEGLPVLLLTALTDVSQRIKGLRSGADDYQVKPFEPDELLARIEGLIARRDIHASRPIAVVRPDDRPAVTRYERPTLAEAIAKLDRHFKHGDPADDVSLGRYEVVDLLGTGAMGTIFRGFDPKLRRPVALKTIRFGSDQMERRSQVTRLLKEAVANARINHPNIVTVYDIGDEGSAAFIAMELVQGMSLEGYLDKYNRVPAGRLLPLAAAVARALGAAHAHDVVHRDVKPGNVLLGDDGTIKVTDFGISEFISKASQSKAIFGTPGYLAPECLEGSKATGKSDLFSLGVVLYEAATGKHPFLAKSWRKTLHRTATYHPPNLHRLVPEIPVEAANLVRLLFEKDEADRPASADGVADAFEDLAAESGQSWELGGEERKVGPPRWRRDSTRSRLVPLGAQGAP